MTVRRLSLALKLETGAMLVVASLTVRLLRFPHRADVRSRRALTTPATVEFADQLCRALNGWNRRLPWRTLCFEQGLAAHWMLNRRGLASTLNYGAALGDRLRAHVWVRSGSRDVTGCENADQFAILARFSNDSSSSPVQP